MSAGWDETQTDPRRAALMARVRGKTRGLKSSFDEPHTHSGLDFVFTVETFPDHLTLSSHG